MYVSFPPLFVVTCLCGQKVVAEMSQERGTTMSEELMLVIDTETLGNAKSKKTLRVYDFGYIVRDRQGVIYEAGSFVVTDVFYQLAFEMQSAYYADKLPQYRQGVAHLGQWEPISFLQLKDLMTDVVRTYGIKRVFAYNAAFDKAALNATTKALSNGFSSYFFPYGVEYCDLWRPACEVIMNNRNYFAFAQLNGFTSEKGNVRTGAEACYSYLTSDGDYVEKHTGLEDVMIESEILTELFKSRKKLDFAVKGTPWHIPQKKYKKWLAKQMA